MKIVSACLCGINCKWDNKSKRIAKLEKELKEGKLIPLCAEQLGGLTTPRSPSGILNGTGKDVLCGKCKVINKKGEDVTRQFIKGAEEVLRIAKKLNIKEVVLKKTSPSCGVGKTWCMKQDKSGKLSNHLIDGDGVSTALLKNNKIKVISEQDI